MALKLGTPGRNHDGIRRGQERAMSQRIFVTGATGYLGGAVAARLARKGHKVYGLTRALENTRALEAVGVIPVIGDLADRQEWHGVLQNCDVAIHAAFDAGRAPRTWTTPPLKPYAMPRSTDACVACSTRAACGCTAMAWTAMLTRPLRWHRSPSCSGAPRTRDRARPGRARGRRGDLRCGMVYGETRGILAAGSRKRMSRER